MSVDFTVYMARHAMPEPREWAKAIQSAGFPAELDSEIDVDTFSGFLPCRYGDREAGFEYESGALEFVDGLELPPDFDFSVTFSTHSSERELASSVVAAAVLCSLSGGILVDPQADATVSADEAIAWARETIGELDL